MILDEHKEFFIQSYERPSHIIEFFDLSDNRIEYMRSITYLYFHY